jgi:methyl-accepting chemotaxis protein
MARRTFGRKLAGGLALTIVLTMLMGASAVAALGVVVASKDAVITSATGGLLTTESLHTAAEQKISAGRGYLVTGGEQDLQQMEADRQRFSELVQQLRTSLDDPLVNRQLDAVVQSGARHDQAIDGLVRLRRAGADPDVIEKAFIDQVAPRRSELGRQIDALTAQTQELLERQRASSSARATRAIIVVIILGALAVLSTILVAQRLSRRLRQEVGATVGHIQSSSTELEAAASQQATGGREQASAMNEITTTISELLITSRQIAAGAQRVSRIAEETADAARTGDATIEQTRASISAIRAQVDQIVQHMLALGERSQQIGGVVDLVSELAEQTNILAINATIEASGAGEWGRRFAVVAEEIRKLADRTAGSAKEIRALIEDVRGAVNTTVMATEIGAKSVDAGSRQFDEATSAFQRIAQLVSTTNDATREIELSTKQQASAVEQVNIAASDTARVTRETEASATQTRQTAAHLSGLSANLLELVGARDGGRP